MAIIEIYTSCRNGQKLQQAAGFGGRDNRLIAAGLCGGHYPYGIDRFELVPHAFSVIKKPGKIAGSVVRGEYRDRQLCRMTGAYLQTIEVADDDYETMAHWELYVTESIPHDVLMFGRTHEWYVSLRSTVIVKGSDKPSQVVSDSADSEVFDEYTDAERIAVRLAEKHGVNAYHQDEFGQLHGPLVAHPPVIVQ